MKSSFESKIFQTNQTLNVRGRLVELAIPKVMGILNVTPDSFFDGGKYDSEVAILNQAEKMIEAGKHIHRRRGYSSDQVQRKYQYRRRIKRVSKAIK